MDFKAIEESVINGLISLSNNLNLRENVENHGFNLAYNYLSDPYSPFGNVQRIMETAMNGGGQQPIVKDNNVVAKIMSSFKQTDESLCKSEDSLYSLIPQALPFSGVQGDQKQEKSAELTDFNLLLKDDHNKVVIDSYSLKVTVWGEKDVEDANLVFCSSEKEIPVLAIKRLKANKSEVLTFSIPFDLYFTAQYAAIYLLDSENRNLANIEIYPIQIIEVMKVNENLQVKIKNYLGTSLDVVIVREDLEDGDHALDGIETKLGAGEIACHTFESKNSKFAVYAAEYMRSNEVAYQKQA